MTVINQVSSSRWAGGSGLTMTMIHRGNCTENGPIRVSTNGITRASVLDGVVIARLGVSYMNEYEQQGRKRLSKEGKSGRGVK